MIGFDRAMGFLLLFCLLDSLQLVLGKDVALIDGFLLWLKRFFV